MFTKKLALLVSILILALTVFISCGGDTEEITTEAPAESTAVPREVYTVAAAGVTDYTVIRPDGIATEALQAAMNLRLAVKEKYGADLSILGDSSDNKEENDPVTSSEDVREILIGNTNRAETRAVAEEFADMKYGFAIKAVNGKIVIWGSDGSALACGINYFTQNLLSDGALKIEKEFLYVWDLLGAGAPLDLISKEYSIICAKSDSNKVWDAAASLAKELGDLSGKSFTPVNDSNASDRSGKEILIGMTDRAESEDAAKDLNYMDYTIRTYENKIVIVGGSPLSTLNAIGLFTDLLKTGTLNSLEAGFVYDYDFDPLIADSLIYRIDSFVPVWADEFTPAEWMTDFDEKLYALTCPTGRMTVVAHRGDRQNYPENSLEGILSAIMLGADVVEIDVRLTKDNVMVLMHDDSLARTTDWHEKAGKNGLPQSNMVANWTYEQLSELRLLSGGKATDCKIPTLYEAAILLADRAQIYLDRKDRTIDVNTDVYFLAEATGSKKSFVYYYDLALMQRWVSRNRNDTEFQAFVATLKGYLKQSNHAMRKYDSELISKYGDHIEGWQKQYSAGQKTVFTNKIYDFSKYIAENGEPFKLP